MKKESGIYMFKCKTNCKYYIGQTNNLKIRERTHFEVNRKKPNEYIQKAWDKYGPDCWEFIILEKCPVDILHEREVYWIDYYDATNRLKGYNILPGGQLNRRGIKNRPSHRQNISKALKGKGYPSLRTLTKDQVFEVLDMIKAGIKKVDISRLTGIPDQRIKGIKYRMGTYADWIAEWEAIQHE